jgi:CheY-like chemotaxis protein
MVHAHKYDAVLMDIQMPDMDGYQATALIRADERHAALPIIAMTAHAVAGYRERCLSMDMNDYVTKPIDPDTLYAVLATWVEHDVARAPLDELEAAPRGQGMAPAAPPNARPGIDMDAALERLGGHSALLTRLLSLFAQDFGTTLQHIHDAIDAGDLAQAAELVHKIRGAAGNISAPDLFETATALEERLREREAALPRLLSDFENAFEIVMHSARDEIAKQSSAPPAPMADAGHTH